MFALEKQQFEQYFFTEDEEEDAKPRPKFTPPAKPQPGKPPTGGVRK
jgi:hypothetical protein